MSLSSENQGQTKTEGASKRIAIFLPSLEKGGAERRMSLLATEFKQRGYDIDMLVLRRKGDFVDIITQSNITIHSVDKGGRFDLIGATCRAVSLFRRERYDVVLSCLPSANMFSVLVKLFSKKTHLIWGIAAADMPMQQYGMWARIGARLQKMLSIFADIVVVNSYFGETILKKQAFQSQCLRVIQNGVDTSKFRFHPESRKVWREQNNIPNDAYVVGIVARLDPAKGIETFLQAIERAQEMHKKDWYFVIVGSGESTYAMSLKAMIQSNPIYEKRLFLLESTQVDHVIYNAFDMLSITSVSESFPNVMLESMACGTRLVSTDVGDCKKVIQNFGNVIAVDDALALFEAWQTGETINKEQPEKMASQLDAMQLYVHENFSIERMVGKFEQLLIEQFNIKSSNSDK
jgi:glycosyltransferase involved in cell wall biosynthesis